MRIAIINYGAGNLFSVANAVKKLGYKAVLTDDPGEITQSDKVILPGVGNALTAMKKIREKGLDKTISSLSQPLLGICLGMQLMFEISDEGDTPCLGMIEGRVVDFGSRSDDTIKVPHMGWNIIDDLKGPLFENIPEGIFMYFVHSYYVPDNKYSVASSYYSGRFSAAIQKDNFFACQFHPEKSGEAGLVILKNFIEL